MSFFNRKKSSHRKQASSSFSSVSGQPPADPPITDDPDSESNSGSPPGNNVAGNLGGFNRKKHFDSDDYARRVQTLLNLLNDLHDLRATQFELSIPSVVVIGNQSSGKSSLIESICTISVPRDSGTCTRCPMRCEIRNTELSDENQPKWTARISIEVPYISDPSKTRFRHFGPAQILDPSEVELWILRAQAAILNPKSDPKLFESLSKDEIKSLRRLSSESSIIQGEDMLFFSTRGLKVVIESEGATPLTFIDLPGIVHNVPEGAPDDTPGLIKHLVLDHIRKPDAIILVTIPAIDERETHEAFRLAKEVDPEKRRTLGVFTKTDLLRETSTSLISERRKDLDRDSTLTRTLGYFAVRLADDTERHLPAESIEAIEKELFKSESPWKDVRDRGRLGVKNLVAHVGRLLADLVDARLPSLLKEVNKAIAENELKLSKLPAETDWSLLRRETKLHLLLAEFVRAVRISVYGIGSETNEYKSLIQHNVAEYKKFAALVLESRPVYATSPSSYWGRIEDVVESCKTFELPINIPYESLKVLINEFTSQWDDPSEKCFQSVAEELSSYVTNKLVSEYFNDFPILRDHVIKISKQSIAERMVEAHKRVRAVWELEKSVPLYTMIHDGYIQGVQTWRSQLNSGFYVHDHEFELELMAKSLAYYDISSKRFIDYVMLTLESELNQAFSNSLHSVLLDNLLAPSGLNSPPPSVDELMAEDPAILAARRSFKEKSNALLGIKSRLLDHEPGLDKRITSATVLRTPSPEAHQEPITRSLSPKSSNGSLSAHSISVSDRPAPALNFAASDDYIHPSESACIVDEALEPIPGPAPGPKRKKKQGKGAPGTSWGNQWGIGG